MPAARTPIRPTRRSLLLSGAVLAPLGLAGCDPEAPEEPEEEPPPRATVTLVPMSTSEDLLPEEPVRVGTWNVSPTVDHPMAMMVSRVRALERDLLVLTLDAPQGTPIPINPGTTTVSVDRHGGLVQVLAGTVVGVEQHHALWRSSDLETWSETDLGSEIDQEVAAFGNGIVVSRARAGSLSVWEIGEDATISVLSSISVPEGHEWNVRDVARAGETIRVLVTSTVEGVESPGLVSSGDGGVSWGELSVLPAGGENPEADSLRALENTIVIVGRHRSAVEWKEETFQWRPTAWSVTPGDEPVHEDIPLPLYGVDEWTSELRGDLHAEMPVDFRHISDTVPVVDVQSGEIHVAVFFGDDCRRATRSAGGHWSVTELDHYAPVEISVAVASPVGQILLSGNRAVSRRGGSEEIIRGLRFSPERTYARNEHGIAEGVDAVLQTSQEVADRDESQYTSSTVCSNQGVRVVDERIEPAEDFPEAATEWEWARVHRPSEGVAFVTGRIRDEDDVLHLTARARLDGEWVETDGLEVEGMFQIGDVRSVNGVTYLPAGGTSEEESSLGGIAVHASPDGIAWERQGVVETSVADAPEFAERVYLNTVVAVGETLIGLGQAHDELNISRAVTYVLQEEVWVPRLIPDLPPGSSLEAAFVVGDQVRVSGTEGDRWFHGTIAADGTVSQTWLSSEQELRSWILDLGSGALLAGGWLDRSSSEVSDRQQVGRGACVWASPDDGETWTATLLPGHEGRVPRVHLALDGEDVVVLAGHEDAPVGFRIVGARDEVLSARV